MTQIDPPATIWQSHRSMIYHIDIDMPWGINLRDVFKYWFELRDSHYGKPKYERSEESGNSVRFNFDMRELAETFFHTWTSEQFAFLLKAHVDPETTEDYLVRTIEILDDYFHYGYILNEGRIRSEKKQTGLIPTPDPVNLRNKRENTHDTDPRYEFWRIFSPSIKSTEWKSIIPKKYWSKSIYRDIESGQDDGVGNYFSPLLKKSRKYDVIEEVLHTYSDLLTDEDIDEFIEHTENDLSGIPKQDAFYLRKLADSGKEITAMDELRFKFLRRWHHPIVLIYDGRAEHPQFHPHGVRARMAYLKEYYTVLDGGVHRINKQDRFSPWVCHERLPQETQEDPLAKMIEMCNSRG